VLRILMTEFIPGPLEFDSKMRTLTEQPPVELPGCFLVQHCLWWRCLGGLGTTQDLKTANAQAYDMVLNGVEIGGGSLRIYRSDVQRQARSPTQRPLLLVLNRCPSANIPSA
jgi:hypothetical protein